MFTMLNTNATSSFSVAIFIRPVSPRRPKSRTRFGLGKVRLTWAKNKIL